MNEQKKHEMALDVTHPSGAEEWNCPTCGRRLLINWEPMFKKTVLEAGDEFSIHSGGKGGLSMSAVQVGDPQEPVLPARIVAALEKILQDSNLDDPLSMSDSDH